MPTLRLRHWTARGVIAIAFALSLGSCRDIWGIDGFEGAMPSGGRAPTVTGGAAGDDNASGGSAPTCDQACTLESPNVYACPQGANLNNRRLCASAEKGDGPHCNPTSGSCTRLLVDPFEVTAAEYELFVAEAQDNPDLLKSTEAACAGANGSAVPDPTCQPTCTENCDDHPQTCVTWCQASAYCRAQGAFLCGRLIDAEIASEPNTDPLPSEGSGAGDDAWVNACSAGGTKPEGYSHLCALSAKDAYGTYPVKQEPDGCSTKRKALAGYGAFYGLQGNVREWVHRLRDSDLEPPDDCRTRGASFATRNDVPCDAERQERCDAARDDIGFRCCGREAASPEGGSSGQ
jgi:formylglycine-generating enzyme